MKQKNKRLEELEFSDDFMFGAVMTNKEICKRFLEVVLGVAIARIEYAERQKIIDVAAFGKSVRLDVYLRDNQNTVYSVEMQQRNKADMPKRSRYYQAMNDLDQLEKGKPYSDLSKSLIIFVCTFDPFERNKQIYTFENRCKEVPELLLGDETMKIFLNAKGTPGQISPELDTLLAYIHRPEKIGEHQSQLVKRIDDEVKNVRISAKWRREYMAFDILLNEAREEAREEGLLQGRKQGIEQGREQGIEQGLEQGRRESNSQIILRMAGLGLTLKEIERLTGVESEEVERVIASAGREINIGE